MGSLYVAQAALELVILLSQLPKFWDYRYASPHLALFSFSFLVLLELELGLTLAKQVLYHLSHSASPTGGIFLCPSGISEHIPLLSVIDKSVTGAPASQIPV
jgi:hypothetical protein